MRKLLTIVICILMFFTMCNVDRDSILRKEAIEYVLDSSIVKLKDYSICGSLDLAFPDSIYSNNLIKLGDSIVNKSDIANLVNQLRFKDKNELSYYFAKESYVQVDRLDDYYNKAFYDIHLILSRPILLQNNKKCIVFVIGVYLKESKYTKCIFVLKRLNDKWVDDFRLFPKIPVASFSHIHDNSFVKKNNFNK